MKVDPLDHLVLTVKSEALVFRTQKINLLMLPAIALLA
jgi:hypothetical protein